MSNLSMSFNILFLWIQQIKTNLHEAFTVLEIMFISYQPMQPFKYLFAQDILPIWLDINYTECVIHIHRINNLMNLSLGMYIS